MKQITCENFMSEITCPTQYSPLAISTIFAWCKLLGVGDVAGDDANGILVPIDMFL